VLVLVLVLDSFLPFFLGSARRPKIEHENEDERDGKGAEPPASVRNQAVKG